MRALYASTMILLLPAAFQAQALGQQCIGAGDANADQVVNLLDHEQLSRCLSGPNQPVSEETCSLADAGSTNLDADDDIDLHDAALFAVLFGRQYFDYGPHREDAEAERLAMPLTQELRVPDYEYERVHRDLGLIREAYPDLSGVVDTPNLAGNALWVRLVSSEHRDGFDEMNAFFVVTSGHEFDFSPGLHGLHFCDNLNTPILALVYEQLDEVEYAHTMGRLCLDDGCCCEIDVTRFDNLFHYAFYYPSGLSPGDGFCYQTRTLETDEAGAVSLVSCTDTCLGDCL